MRNIVMVAIAGFGLAGCSSMPSFDLFKSKPQLVTLQLESTPPGAEARTSIGPSCKTPCSVSVPAAENFTVAYALNKYKPETVPVQVVAQGDNPPLLDPSPVVAELQPLIPPKKGRVAAAPKPVKRAAKPAEADEDSPFPPPTR